ncbi:MAG: BCCT family transporter [Mogibacterium sp.]|nr:BCCT family transporter [Mogibacterium sp.]
MHHYKYKRKEVSVIAVQDRSHKDKDKRPETGKDRPPAVKLSHRDHTVYIWSLIISGILIVWSIAFSESFHSITYSMFSWLSTYTGWLYLLVMTCLVVFCIVLAVGRYGNVKLGPDDVEADYSYFSWFAMLFCAGMGVGLVFWGVSEPLSHFVSPDGIPGGTPEAADFAIQASFMHWGVHPWTIYGVLGLCIAYFGFRRGEKNLISSAFIPLVGRKGAEGFLGQAVDVLTVVISVMGIASTLGLSALQISSGLESLGTGVKANIRYQIAIIAIVTVCFLASSISGVDKGIKILSNFNLVLAFLLMGLAFIVGPSVTILNSLVDGLGAYVSGFVRESLRMRAYGDNSWIVNWRVFYWAWWISWGPFVGCFIARISRGRTIREFVLGVLLVPTIVSCIWFSIFGSLGIDLGLKGIIPVEHLGEIVAAPDTALFTVLGEYPLGTLLSVIAILLLFTFFITSADSGTFVLSMFSSHGEPNPSNVRKATWGLLISLMAAGLLLSGGLKVVQTVSIVIAFPFLFIMVAGAIAIAKSLRNDEKAYSKKQK